MFPSFLLSPSVFEMWYRPSWAGVQSPGSAWHRDILLFWVWTYSNFLLSCWEIAFVTLTWLHLCLLCVRFPEVILVLSFFSLAFYIALNTVKARHGATLLYSQDGGRRGRNMRSSRPSSAIFEGSLGLKKTIIKPKPNNYNNPLKKKSVSIKLPWVFSAFPLQFLKLLLHAYWVLSYLVLVFQHIYTCLIVL